MILGMLSRLARVRITLSYAAALVAVSTTLVLLGPRVQHQVILHVSTNLHNLARGKIGTLFGSAFVIDAAPMYIWLPGLVCLLALAELHWRSGRLTLAFLLGHVGATLVVAAGLVAAIEFGWLPLSISRASDVGVSYGAVAVLGALTTAIPRRWRPVWMGWWLAVAVSSAALGAEFTDAGHTVALLIGLALATRFGRPAHWTPVRYALLAVGAAFGFLLLAHTAVTALTGLALGTLSGVAAHTIVRWRLTRKPLETSALAAEEPVAQELSRVPRSSPA
ncbi:rhomboid-like protein [Mycobacterium xenopi]|uniref:rhomboid-like protein n=1 Tax=Mycobacterium xenopi TaxID=1789 RepID=UPI000682E19D|nr:rhomboid-like protein [Mycobacterium xenopi]